MRAASLRRFTFKQCFDRFRHLVSLACKTHFTRAHWGDYDYVSGNFDLSTPSFRNDCIRPAQAFMLAVVEEAFRAACPTGCMYRTMWKCLHQSSLTLPQ